MENNTLSVTRLGPKLKTTNNKRLKNQTLSKKITLSLFLGAGPCRDDTYIWITIII
jgi:hypothetical protein